MNEFLKSPEFKLFYERQIEAMVEYMLPLMFRGSIDLAEMKGAMGLARKVILLPEHLGDEDHYMKQLTIEGFRKFQTEYIRKHIFA